MNQIYNVRGDYEKSSSNLLDNQINLVVAFIDNLKKVKLHDDNDPFRLEEKINLAVDCFTKIRHIKSALNLKDAQSSLSKSHFKAWEKNENFFSSCPLTSPPLDVSGSNKLSPYKLKSQSQMDAHIDSIVNTIDYLKWQTREIEKIQKDLEHLINAIEKFNTNRVRRASYLNDSQGSFQYLDKNTVSYCHA